MLSEHLMEAGIVHECNVRELPGTPDFFVRSVPLAIFYNGCFWHGHHCKPSPESFVWQDKIDAIKNNDLHVAKQLASAGIDVLVLWECEVDKDISGTLEYIRSRINVALQR